jgi:DNA-binding XRE family transcriptional regulator
MGHKSWSEIRRRKVPPEAEVAMAASGRALRDALELAELRKANGLTQVELANRLGVSQGSVSELERRDDVYLSTLREYVQALGGELEVAAVFDGDRHPIAIG